MFLKRSFLLLGMMTLVLSGCSTNAVSSKKSGAITSSSGARFIEYSESNSDIGKKPLALFFHATWCPTCAVLEKNIKANLDRFPSKAIIVKADFDTETALKARYRILVQSTVVILDKEGEAVDVLSNPSVDELISSLNSVL